jgi:TM2 domain-containing membrane protein YozV
MTCILLLSLKNFGFFTMFFAQGFSFLGAQVIFLGISGRGFAQFRSFLVRNDPVDRFMRSFTLEKGIALGVFLSIAGLGICGWVGYRILEFMANPANAGIFNAGLTKIGVVGSTLAVLGLQMVFSSFYSGLFNVEVAEDTFPDSN